MMLWRNTVGMLYAQERNDVVVDGLVQLSLVGFGLFLATMLLASPHTIQQ